jgi:hypothetical protein
VDLPGCEGPRSCQYRVEEAHIGPDIVYRIAKVDPRSEQVQLMKLVSTRPAAVSCRSNDPAFAPCRTLDDPNDKLSWQKFERLPE